ncbi:MAG TPA: DNA-protecting protein DprA [Rhodospirillaceae bacterium]|nr:DNA-protecting protein DprA [Rhodospirillaceae bacterium]
MAGHMQNLPDGERCDWLRLYRCGSIGPASFFRLIARFGSASRAIEALPDLLRRPLQIPSRAAAERELDDLARLGGRLITAGDAAFPEALRASGQTPLIMVLGNAVILDSDAVAIVGARNASLAGCRLARGLAGDLAASGLTVVSGLARGIDRAAHEGALPGPTVAVVAGGVDVVYPAEHRDLHRRLADEGCVLSEMPPGCQPTAAHFPRRNRLIAGLSLGVVVVEAALQSGSLITARQALDQGRELFAVPGSPQDPRSRGPNALLRQGAVLTESAADVLDALQPMRRRPGSIPAAMTTPALPVDGPPEHELVVKCLGTTPVTVDEIVRQCQLSPAVVSMVLLDLELAGRLERRSGNLVSLLS